MTAPYKVPKRFETQQEIIDYVVPLLYAQGRPSILGERTCAYRAGELKCFAGFLINDEDYSLAIENCRASQDVVASKLQINVGDNYLLSFVDFCQQVIHDHESSSDKWLSNLPQRVALVCNSQQLSVPPIVASVQP